MNVLRPETVLGIPNKSRLGRWTGDVFRDQVIKAEAMTFASGATLELDNLQFNFVVIVAKRLLFAARNRW